MTTNIINDNWSEPWVPPVRTVEEWEKEWCACRKCGIRMNYHDCTKQPPFGYCFKEMAYDKVLEQKAQYLVRPWTDPKPFKPASRDQIAKWASWLASPEAAKAAKAVSEIETGAKRTYSATKFEPVNIARQLNSMFPKDLEKFQSGGYMRAFNAYKTEQFKLLDNYKKTSKCINTAVDYDTAEKAYKALSSHVNTHGDIIMGMPSKQHKKPDEAVADAPVKTGRRATRRALNEAEMNDTTRVYTAAEMRRLARGLPADEEPEDE